MTITEDTDHMAAKYAFKPDYIVPPGETLRETLEAKGLSQSELAVRVGMAEKTVSQIINGLAPISFETAEKLEMATGVPASFWNRMELDYREGLAQREEMEKFASDVQWLDEIPVNVLVDRGFVEKATDKAVMVHRVLKFYGVGSVGAWRSTWAKPCGLYRGKAVQEKYPGAVSAWRRMGEIKADRIATEAFDAREFRRVLTHARSLTTKPMSKWDPELSALCATAGVQFVIVREIPNASISGFARWRTKDRAFIQLSLKYKTDDQVWFTFFHEAAHILLHSKKLMFFDEGMSEDTEEEKEANAFARDILIPPEHAKAFHRLHSRNEVRRFAASIGISPGIVVGRLQHDGFFNHDRFYDLKVKYEWA
jgi:HTH-type transcriptional regulator/antitoxin HigA